YKFCRGIAWQPEVVARRIISWLSHSNLLLDDTGPDQHAMYMHSLTKNIRVLSGLFAQAHDGYPRIVSLLALVLAGLCIDQQDKLIDDNLKRLCFELDRQIDEQGAHISRNPDVCSSLLLDLLPMKQCFSPRHQEPPESILKTIDRMLSFLKFVRLGDGALAHFNGVSFTKPDVLGTVMSYDESVPLNDGAMAASGYIRMQSHSSILLMDAGELPSLAYSDSAGAGSLAFELSRGIWPVFVNCGAPNATNTNWRLQSRMTSNHNTLTIEDSSSSQLVKTPSLAQTSDRWLLRGPAEIEVKPMSNASELQVKASHDGYRNKYGIIFERFLSLGESGTVLKGEEFLRSVDQKKTSEITSKWPFKWHFHIHPDVRVMRNENPHQVILELKNGERWLFESELAADLEESLHLATIREPRKSIRIVLRMANQKNTKMNWILRLVASGQQVEESPPPKAD
ncbi:MAG: heparinase II/III family protein, partial [Methyloligellaceae bacterium]